MALLFAGVIFLLYLCTRKSLEKVRIMQKKSLGKVLQTDKKSLEKMLNR